VPLHDRPIDVAKRELEKKNYVAALAATFFAKAGFLSGEEFDAAVTLATRIALASGDPLIREAPGSAPVGSAAYLRSGSAGSAARSEWARAHGCCARMPAAMVRGSCIEVCLSFA
jgi:hypothetical protein